MVNFSSLFISYEYGSYAFIASPMSHLCVPLLLIKLNDYAIPHWNFVFADPTTMMQADDPEYRKVFATLDELDLGSLKPVFKEKRFRVTSHITNTRVVESHQLDHVLFF